MHLTSHQVNKRHCWSQNDGKVMIIGMSKSKLVHSGSSSNSNITTF